jgi:hypothetical protein
VFFEAGLIWPGYCHIATVFADVNVNPVVNITIYCFACATRENEQEKYILYYIAIKIINIIIFMITLLLPLGLIL